jgi:predicted negative regulator of RcsB-dependent stress response
MGHGKDQQIMDSEKEEKKPEAETQAEAEVDESAQTPGEEAGTAVPSEWEELKERLGTMLAKNGKPVAIALALVLLAAAGGTAYQRYARSKVVRASTDLFSARSLQDLEIVARRYPSTPSASLALLRIAKGYYDIGNYTMAVAKYDEFLAKYPQHELVLSAELGRIHCFEARGQSEEALAGYTSFASRNVGHYLVPMAVFGQGRCLEHLGRGVEARTVYEDFIAANAGSAWTQRAEQLLAALTKKLATTNALPAAAAGPAAGWEIPSLALPVTPAPAQ